MSRLNTLRENRAKAKDAVDATMAELEAVINGDGDIEGRAWNADEEAKLTEQRNRVTQLDTLIDAAEAEERDADEQEEQRSQRSVVTQTNAVDTLTYSEGNPDNSFYRDLLAAAMPATRGFDAAKARLNRHEDEMDAIRSRGARTPEGKALRKFDISLRSTAESRAVSTGTASMGDFAPPVYMLAEYSPYRTYGRTLIDQLAHRDLPESGMVINVPSITQPTEGINQTTATQGAGENQSVATRDVTSTYNGGAVQTIIDNLNVSQQYLDRVGPGINGDQIIRDDQQRQVNRTLNLFAWNTIFGATGVGTVQYTDSAFNAQTFNQKLHTAKANIQKTDGTVAYPTHVITDVDLWETFEGSYDSNNRPYVVPQGVAFNPLAVGDNANVPEGYSGFHVAGLPAFKDQADWISWSGGAASSGFSGDHVALVGALDIAAFWMEGTPVVRVLPQPGAATLTVLIQSYVYAALVINYPTALQLVFGSGTSTANLTA